MTDGKLNFKQKGEMIFNQAAFDIRFEWGRRGVEELAPISDVIIIVDVLSFSTAVDIATANGALVFPFGWKDERAAAYAKGIGAELAIRRGSRGYSLSASSLVEIPAGTKLVLPSPNGSTLSIATGGALTVCGCLRNAKAVADYAITVGRKVAVIAAGEHWPDGSLRPAFEDLVGAGAIIASLQGSLSPESKAALGAFTAVKNNLEAELKKCASGLELIEPGYENDVVLASQLNISGNVPVLKETAYTSISKA
jgi:2-phosphosulfolactate phosphatase